MNETYLGNYTYKYEFFPKYKIKFFKFISHSNRVNLEIKIMSEHHHHHHHHHEGYQQEEYRREGYNHGGNQEV